jgi:hypothetical protein
MTKVVDLDKYLSTGAPVEQGDEGYARSVGELRSEAANCELIAKLATGKTNRETFTNLAELRGARRRS